LFMANVSRTGLKTPPNLEEVAAFCLNHSNLCRARSPFPGLPSQPRSGDRR
jgi:hypothetical protein